MDMFTTTAIEISNGTALVKVANEIRQQQLRKSEEGQEQRKEGDGNGKETREQRGDDNREI